MGIPRDFTNPNDAGNGQGTGTSAPVIMGASGGGQQSATDALINYNEKFRDADPAPFRDDAIAQTMSILIGRNKPNALLVGPAGVGKTKIVEDIARRIACKDPTVPDKLAQDTVYELPLSAVVSGSGIVGDLEAKMEEILSFASDPHVIIFIDEIHQLASPGNETYRKIGQLLKPALARGDIRCIGATTTQEAKDLMNDPAFSRRFSRVIVDELTKAQTEEILINAKAGFMKHHDYKVKLDDSLMKSVVELAEEYRPAGGHRPDTALTLLDRSISDAVVARKRQEAALAADPSQKAMLAALKSVQQIPVTEKQVRQTAIRLATGNSKPEAIDDDALKRNLSAIKGQDDILEPIVKELKRNEMRLFPSKSPLTLLFIGPSGVGKTEVSKILAQALTGCPPIILNMTEYSDPSTVNKIIGSPAGYVGSESHSELPFDILESNPYQFILLDEFEKCHPSVQKLFMQVFDEGVLKTNRGTSVDFSKAIIVATTNAGHTVRKNPLGFGQAENEAQTSVADLSAYFEPALLNRFKARYTFHPIDRETYKEILKSAYTAKREQVLASKPYAQLPDEMPDADAERITEETYVPEFGARPTGQAVEEFIYDCLG